MQAYIGLITIFLFILTVMSRSFWLKKQGIQPVEFGRKNKTDFILIPFALFYFYLLIANAFHLPTIPQQSLFHSETISWIGVIFCCLSVLFFLWSMVSFKKSFRVGLVENRQQGLITSGAFSISRNPIYVSFAMMLTGQFLVFPSWIFLIYIFLGFLTLHRRILIEEKFLDEQYGNEFKEYCKKVRRYL